MPLSIRTRAAVGQEEGTPAAMSREEAMIETGPDSAAINPTPLTRRDFLRKTAALAGALPTAALLASCAEASPGTGAVSETTPEAVPTNLPTRSATETPTPTSSPRPTEWPFTPTATLEKPTPTPVPTITPEAKVTPVSEDLAPIKVIKDLTNAEERKYVENALKLRPREDVVALYKGLSPERKEVSKQLAQKVVTGYTEAYNSIYIDLSPTLKTYAIKEAVGSGVVGEKKEGEEWGTDLVDLAISLDGYCQKPRTFIELNDRGLKQAMQKKTDDLFERFMTSYGVHERVMRTSTEERPVEAAVLLTTEVRNMLACGFAFDIPQNNPRVGDKDCVE